MERTYTVDELFGAIRRRWKWMAIVAGTVFALAAIVIAKLPNEYRARALAMVEPLQPPDLPPRALLAFGTERYGLSRELLGRADQALGRQLARATIRLGTATLPEADLLKGREGS